MASGRAFSEVTGKDRSDFVEYPDGLHECCIPYICDKHRATPTTYTTVYAFRDTGP